MTEEKPNFELQSQSIQCNTNVNNVYRVTHCQDRDLYSVVLSNDVSNCQCTYLIKTKSIMNSILKIAPNVTSIGSKAFSGLKISEIVIPKSIVSIGDECFYRCRHLTSVVFERGSELICIGNSAFSRTSIERIEIPEKLTKIPRCCFSWCKDLKTVQFNGDSIETIEEGAFLKTAIKEIEIPRSVKYLREGCFSLCESLHKLSLQGNAIEYIGKRAFFKTAISQIKTPVTKPVPYDRFGRPMRELFIPKSVKYLGKQCFAECRCLTTVRFESGSLLESIPCKCFYNCVLLSSFDFGEGSSVSCIEDDAFFGSAVKTLTLPRSIYYISEKCGVENFRPSQEACDRRSILVFDTHEKQIAVRYNYTRMDQLIVSNKSNALYMDYENPEYCCFEARNNHIRQIITHRYSSMELKCKLQFICIPSNVGIIREMCFMSCSLLSRVTFESRSCLKCIEKLAFSGCSSLREIEIPLNVEVLGERSFENCCKLSRVAFEAGSHLKTIGDGAFCKCPVIEAMKMPSKIECIPKGAFSNSNVTSMFIDCDNACLSVLTPFIVSHDESLLIALFQMLKYVIIPAETQVIGEYCFYECKSLCSVTFQASSKLKSLGGSAFYGCDHLAEITIPNTVESIGESCFQLCKALWKVTFERVSRLKTIGKCAFDWTGLQRIEIPASVEFIGDMCFGRCEHISCVTFEAKSCLKEIGKMAFNSSSLQKIEIPAGVQCIQTRVFYWCKNYEASVADGNTHYRSVNSLLLSYDACRLISPLKDIVSVIVPSTVTVIESRCFYTASVKEITFQYNSRLTRVEKYAFAYSKLEAVEFPASLEVLCKYCFRQCYNLKSVTFAHGSRLKRLETGIFCGDSMNLRHIEIPESVTEIQGGIFSSCEITNLEIQGNSNYEVRESVLMNKKGTEMISLIHSLSEVCIPASVEMISADCFRSFHHLSKITFERGSRLKQIMTLAISETSITEICIPAGVERIFHACFEHCKALKRVRFEEKSKLKYIDSEAFSSCGKLKEITLPMSVEFIGEKCFSSCVSLLCFQCETGSALRRIDRFAFQECIGLQVCEIPASVEIIGAYCFKYCKSLCEVMFQAGSNLKMIGEGAFLSSGLENINIPSGAKVLCKTCFELCKII